MVEMCVKKVTSNKFNSGWVVHEIKIDSYGFSDISYVSQVFLYIEKNKYLINQNLMKKCLL